VFELVWSETEPLDGKLYPPHFLDIAPYMSENNKEASYLYEIDSIIHYVKPNRVGYLKPNGVGHFTTAIPLDKDYDRWRVWDNEKASEVSREQLDFENTHVVFYRKKKNLSFKNKRNIGSITQEIANQLIHNPKYNQFNNKRKKEETTKKEKEKLATAKMQKLL
jgi:hypothetical protein